MNVFLRIKDVMQGASWYKIEQKLSKVVRTEQTMSLVKNIIFRLMLIFGIQKKTKAEGVLPFRTSVRRSL